EDNTKLPDAKEQAGWLARQSLLLHSGGIERFFWYAYDDTRGGTLFIRNSGLTAAGVALRELIGWMTGAVVAPCVEAADHTWSCAVSRPGYSGLILWNFKTPKSVAAPMGFSQF